MPLDNRQIGRWLCATLVVALLYGIAPVLAAQPPGEPTDRKPVAEGSTDVPDLDRILRRLSRYADLYAAGALGFTCEETIRYRGAGYGRGRVDYHYVYRHVDGELEDYRISTAVGRSKDRDRRIDYPGPSIVLRPYSWIFNFQSTRQPFYDYRIVETGEVLGRPAIKLWIQPQDLDAATPEINDWAGEFWIDRDTLLLLRVDAMRAKEYRSQLRLEEAFASLEADPAPHRHEPSEHSVERVTTVFGVVEQGIRYPSEVTIERRRYAIPVDTDLDGGTMQYTVRQAYSDYRFYTTSATTQFLRILEEP